MQSRYMNSTAMPREEMRTLAGRFRGGKLVPVMAVPFRESEGGTVQQTITFELDPVAGRIITPVTAEVISVFVPALAIEVTKFPLEQYAGNAELFRDKLTSGIPVFGLEPETEISKRLGVVPRSINGTKQVNEAARLACIAAINFLRRRKYVKATELPNTHTGLSPALISQTVLDRLNGVLDPEDRVNGAVNLSGQIPIRGISSMGNANGSADAWVGASGGATGAVDLGSTGMGIRFTRSPDTPSGTSIYVDFDDASQSLSLDQFYTAERMDSMTREFRKIVDANPEYGEEMLVRLVHGLSVEVGKQPFVAYQKQMPLNARLKSGMDGPSLDLEQTHMVGQVNFMVPVPKTEFGGVMITFACIKPDETMKAQPHPILSDLWAGRNYAADELKIDPVPVYGRDLNGDIAQAQEVTTPLLYVGNNHLLRRYVNYGFNRHVDPNTVANKTAIWQIDIPMSVSPDNILYPEDLSHYPFADQNAEVVQYTCNSRAVVQTPIIWGPSPVEELAVLDSENIFEDQPE